MRLAGCFCVDCGGEEIIAVWPGREEMQADMLRPVPNRPARGWRERCWLKRFGPKPTLPRRGSRRVSAPLTQD